MLLFHNIFEIFHLILTHEKLVYKKIKDNFCNKQQILLDKLDAAVAANDISAHMFEQFGFIKEKDGRYILYP